MKYLSLTLLLVYALSIFLNTSMPTAVETQHIPQRFVALTFDDGPWPQTTERLLDGLKERGVKATFFLIGEQIAAQEDIVLRMAAEGHQIGNHTWSHVRLDQVPTAVGLQEIEKTNAALCDLLGEGEYWVRPPWGFISEQLRKDLTVPLIHWSVDPEDWCVLNGEKVAYCILDAEPDGDIILLHDPYASSVTAALAVVDELLEQGVEFVTVEELFALSGEEPQSGLLYERPGQTR